MGTAALRKKNRSVLQTLLLEHARTHSGTYAVCAVNTLDAVIITTKMKRAPAVGEYSTKRTKGSPFCSVFVWEREEARIKNQRAATGATLS